MAPDWHWEPPTYHRLSQLDKYVSICFQFYHLSKFLRDENKNNASSIQSPLSLTPFCFVNISAPLNRIEMVLYSKFMYGSQFLGEKNDLKIQYLVAEIFWNICGNSNGQVFSQTPFKMHNGGTTTYDGRRPMMEDDSWWKTTYDGRRLMMEDD